MTKKERKFVIYQITAIEKFIEQNRHQAKYGSPVSSMAEDMACYRVAEVYEEYLFTLQTLLNLSK